MLPRGSPWTPKTNLKDFQEQTKKIVDDAMETLDKKISELEAKKARDR